MRGCAVVVSRTAPLSAGDWATNGRSLKGGLRAPASDGNGGRRGGRSQLLTRATYTGSPPVSLTTKVVAADRLDDFTRLTVLIPASVAAAVRVGTAVRLNGTPLIVASIGGGRNGADVTASFGVSLASPSTRDLVSLYPEATVSVEILGDGTEGAGAVDWAGLDAFKERERRESEDGLPGSRQWYSNTLPWYSQVYATHLDPDPVAAEEEASGPGEWIGEKSDSVVDYSRNLTDYERYTQEQSQRSQSQSQSQSQGQWGQQEQDRRLGSESSVASGSEAGWSRGSDTASRREEEYSWSSSSSSPPSPSPPPPPSPPSPFSSSSFSSTYVSLDAVDDSSIPSLSSSPEVEVAGGWSQQPPPQQSPEFISSDPQQSPEFISSDPQEARVPAAPPQQSADERDNYYSYSAAAASSITAVAPVNNSGIAPTNADGKYVSPADVVGALENMARRNNYLTDRVEKLLDVIESKGGSSLVAAFAANGAVDLSADPSVVSAESNLRLNAPSLSLDDRVETQAEADAEVRHAFKEEEEEEEAAGADKLGPAAVREPSVEVCVMQHPGALCCTRSEVAMDEDKRQATITLHTSVRAVQSKGVPSDSMKMADLVALGAQAIADKAREMMELRTSAAVSLEACEETERAHDRITRLLQNGKVIWVEGMGEVEGKFGHPCYKLRLECTEGTDAVIDCVFKPAIEGDGDGWHRASMEYVAYRLSRMLGMDNVPPAAYRRPEGGIELDYKKFDEGAFLYWVDGADELVKAGDFTQACETGCWGDGVDPRLVLSDTRILDVLLHNSDRHSGHFLFARHWTQGGPPHPRADDSSGSNGGGGGPASDNRPVLSGSEYRPVLIDHAASFRREAFVSMEHENAFQTGPTTCVGCKTYLRLRFLDAKAIKDEFGDFLSASEQSALLERRNNILAYLDRLVDTQGYDKTVIH